MISILSPMGTLIATLATLLFIEGLRNLPEVLMGNALQVTSVVAVLGYGVLLTTWLVLSIMGGRR